MKALFVFLLVAAVSANEFGKLAEQDTPAFDFIKGFLKGIGENKSIDDLLKCLENAEKIVEEIQQAIKYISEFSMQGIIKGLELLIKAVTEFSEMIKPCAHGYEILGKLLMAIYNTEFKVLIQRFLSHATQLFTQVTYIVACFQSGNYEGAGQGVGSILKMLFLDEIAEMSANPKIEEFVMGFLDGIGETGNKTHVLECVKEVEATIPLIKAALEKIKSRHIREIQEGVKELIVAVKQMLDYLKPCSEELPVLKQLIHSITHVNPKEVVEKVLTHMKELVDIIVKALECFKQQDYKCAGRTYGGILKILFL